MIYVLIVMTWLGNSASYVVHTQEFSNSATCQNAADTIRARWDGLNDRLQAWCVVK